MAFDPVFPPPEMPSAPAACAPVVAGAIVASQVHRAAGIDLPPQIPAESRTGFKDMRSAAAQRLPQVIFLAVGGQGEQHLLWSSQNRGEFSAPSASEQAILGGKETTAKRRQIL